MERCRACRCFSARRRIEPALRAHEPSQLPGGFPHQIIDAARPHDAGIGADLLGTGEIDEHGDPGNVRMLDGEIREIVQELVPIGQAAQRIDPAKGMLQLNLRHDHRGQIFESGHLGCTDHTWLGP
jgi:hypothetical protein